MPEFSLKDQEGNLFHSAEHLGEKPLVIFFYPKDVTPGHLNLPAHQVAARRIGLEREDLFGIRFRSPDELLLAADELPLRTERRIKRWPKRAIASWAAWDTTGSPDMPR